MNNITFRVSTKYELYVATAASPDAKALALHSAYVSVLQADYVQYSYKGTSSVSKAARRYKALGIKAGATPDLTKKKGDGKKGQARKVGRNLRKRARRNAGRKLFIENIGTVVPDYVATIAPWSASAIAGIGTKLAVLNAGIVRHAAPAKVAVIKAVEAAKGNAIKYKDIVVPTKAKAIRGTVTFRTQVAFVVGSTITGGSSCRLPRPVSATAGVGFGTKTAKSVKAKAVKSPLVAIKAATPTAEQHVAGDYQAAAPYAAYLARAREFRRAAESAWKPLTGFVMQAGAGQSTNSEPTVPAEANSVPNPSGVTVTNSMNLKDIVLEYNHRASPDYPMMQRSERTLSQVLAIGNPVAAVYGKDVVQSVESERSIEGIQYSMLKLLCRMSLRSNMATPIATNGVLRWFNHHWTQEDAVFFCKAITRMTIRSGKSYTSFKENGPDLTIYFDAKEQRYVNINSRGVFVSDRGLEVTPLLLIADGAQKPEHMCFLNGYGVLCFFMLTLGRNYLFKQAGKGGELVIMAEQFFDEVLLGKKGGFPVTNENEVGVLDGDRASFTKYATQSRFFTPGTTFSPIMLMTAPDDKGNTVHVARFTPEFSVDWAKTWEMEEAPFMYEPKIFEFFNLVSYKPKEGIPNSLIDGRKVCVRVKDMPEAFRARYVRKVITENLGAEVTPAELAASMGAEVLPGDAEAWLTENLVVTLSSKVNKLVKRTVMDSALVGEILNSLGRCYEVFGQEMSYNTAHIKACVSLTLVAAAGAAMHWGTKPVLKSYSSSRRQPGFKPVLDASGQPAIDWIYQPSSITVECAMNVARWDNKISLLKGDVIARIPYVTLEGTESWIDITANDDGGYLNKITWGMQRVAGNQEDLVIKYETYSLETSMKARSFKKAMMVHYHDGVLKNALNGDAYAEALFPRDTNKWTDLVLGCVDIAAATFVHNKAHPTCAAGYDMVLKANAMLGSGATDRLVYHPTLALVGVYKGIQAEFEKLFGKAVWATWDCGTEGAWALHMNAQYVCQRTAQPVDGWVRINAGDYTTLAPKAQVIMALAQAESADVIDDKTNLLFVILDEGVYSVVQRGWSFIGTEDCPVLVPVKFEIASVNSALSTSRLMAGVARNVYAQNAELGMALLADGEKNVQLAATHVALSNGQGLVDKATGLALAIVPMMSAEEGINGALLERIRKAVREEIAAEADQSNLLGAFAKRFKNVIFTFECAQPQVARFSIWFPALFEQDASMDYRSQDSLSALARNLFVYLGTSETLDMEKLGLLLRRIKASYKKIAGSENIIKASSFGRRNAQAKPVGIPEVPLGEIWIKSATHGRSVCHVFKSVGITDGTQTVVCRAPMTEAMFVETRIIARNSRYGWMADDVIYMNNLASAVHGGDYDGDSNAFTRADEVEMPKLNLVSLYQLIEYRTGSNQLAKQVDGSTTFGGVYYCDHFEIKSLASLAKKAGVKKANFTSIAGLGKLLERSTETLGSAVGKIHGAALYVDLRNTFVADEDDEQFALNMIRVMYEVYEIPLAGLDEALYELCYGNGGDNLLLRSKGAGLVDVDAFAKRHGLAAAAGMNANRVNDIYRVTHEWLAVFDGLKSERNAAGYIQTNGAEPYCLQQVLAYACLQLSKGNLRPGKSASYEIVVEYLRAELNLTDETVAVNPVIWSFATFLRYVGKALAYEALSIDVALFLRDEDGNGGGGAPVPTPPAPSGGGGGQMVVSAAPSCEPTPVAATLPVQSNIEQEVEVAVQASEQVEFIIEDTSLIDEALEWRDNLRRDILCLAEWSMLSNDQLIAVWRICREDHADCITLTGRAGAGKSFVIETCRKILHKQHVEVIVIGSTGVASTNVGGEGTINSFAGLGKGDALPLGQVEYVEDSAERKRKKMTTCIAKVQARLSRGSGPVCVFIEEVSMCSSEILVLMYQAVSEACRLLHRPVYFVPVGDLRQLKVVGKEDEEANWLETRSAPFAHATFMLNRKNDAPEVLTYGSLLSDQGPFLMRQGLSSTNWRAERISLVTNHRQKTSDTTGAAFLNALNALGDGVPFSDERLYPIAERIFIPQGDGYSSMLTGEHVADADLDEALHVYFTNPKVNAHNTRCMERLQARGAHGKVFCASISTGEWNKKKILSEMQPVSEETLICVGMRFMVRINVTIDGTTLANGTIGTVVKVGRDSFDLRLPDGEQVTIRETHYPMPIAKNGGEVGRVKTVAIGHAAYGSTAWKTQGLTVKEVPNPIKGVGKVVVHVDYAMVEHGLLYTVCSRVQSCAQLIIVAKNPSDVERMAVADPDMASFIRESEASMHSFMSDSAFVFKTESRVVNEVELAVRHVYYRGRHYVVNSRNEGYYYEGGWRPVQDSATVAKLVAAS